MLDRHGIDHEAADDIGQAISAGEFTAAFDGVTEAMLDASYRRDARSGGRTDSGVRRTRRQRGVRVAAWAGCRDGYRFAWGGPRPPEPLNSESAAPSDRYAEGGDRDGRNDGHDCEHECRQRVEQCHAEEPAEHVEDAQEQFRQQSLHHQNVSVALLCVCVPGYHVASRELLSRSVTGDALAQAKSAEKCLSSAIGGSQTISRPEYSSRRSRTRQQSPRRVRGVRASTSGEEARDGRVRTVSPGEGKRAEFDCPDAALAVEFADESLPGVLVGGNIREQAAASM